MTLYSDDVADDALHVIFYSRPIKMEYLSTLKGQPVYEDRLYIRIQAPGNTYNIVDTEATDRHKQRFGRQYLAYMTQQAGAVNGTALSVWSDMPSELAGAFEKVGFMTVEQLAASSDMQLQPVMGASAWRERAKEWVARTHKQADKNEIAELKAQIAALSDTLNKLMPQRGKKRDVDIGELTGDAIHAS